MAKKGQKFNTYTEEFKIKIVEEYEKGESGGSVNLGKKYNISYRTIDTWIYKYRKQGHLSDPPLSPFSYSSTIFILNSSVYVLNFCPFFAIKK